MTGHDHHTHEEAATHHHDEASLQREILTIRCHSGLSGDMMLTGLAVLNLEKENITPDSEEGAKWLDEKIGSILPSLAGNARLVQRDVRGVLGWHAAISLPHEHSHRNLADILQIISQSSISPLAKEKAAKAFELVARAEACVHGKAIEEVHFHEVGALDSILDICASCELFSSLGAPELICAPLPIADGKISCAHGILPAPAPAVLKLLKGVPLRPFEGEICSGELVTPTAIALLLVLDASFGAWPHFSIKSSALVYGEKIFPDAPNGVIFALGENYS